MGWISFAAQLINRLPWERAFLREPDRTESLKKLQSIVQAKQFNESTPIVEPISPTVTKIRNIQVRGVPDAVLLKDARRRLKFEGVKLRQHLSLGCRIDNLPCDCCEKGIINIDHAMEDILAIEPSNTPALDLQNWALSHADELSANTALDRQRGLALAAELRLLLKACGAAVEPQTPTLAEPPPLKLIEATKTAPTEAPPVEGLTN